MSIFLIRLHCDRSTEAISSVYNRCPWMVTRSHFTKHCVQERDEPFLVFLHVMVKSVPTKDKCVVIVKISEYRIARKSADYPKKNCHICVILIKIFCFRSRHVLRVCKVSKYWSDVVYCMQYITLWQIWRSFNSKVKGRRKSRNNRPETHRYDYMKIPVIIATIEFWSSYHL